MTIKNDKLKNAKAIASDLSLAERQSPLDKSTLWRQTTFTNQDWKMIFDMEANPTEPTERMKKALWTIMKLPATKIRLTPIVTVTLMKAGHRPGK